MREVLLSYIQFLFIQVAEHALPFLLVLLGVPALWLVLKLTDLLYEEKALSLGAVVFGLSSFIAPILFLTSPTPEEYYKPMLLLLAGFLTYLCVAPIFCGTSKMVVNLRKKTFTIDGKTFPCANISQVNVSRCFNRTKRACLMEVFVSEENSRPITLYYETNNIAEFRKNVLAIKNFAVIDYDSSLAKLSVEKPSQLQAIKVALFSLVIFCLILPATISLNETRSKRLLPEYKLEVIPKELYSKETFKAAETDVFKELFNKSDVQLLVFDGPHSSHFTGNYRKALYSYPNKAFEFNILFVRKNGLQLKQGLGAKERVSKSPANVYTTFVTDKCNKLCFIDNQLKVLYSTDIETVDSRVNNVQSAVNMLDFVHSKRIEQLRIREARKKQMASSEE